MRLVLFIAVVIGIIFAFQNCQDLSSLRPNSDQGDAQEVITVIGDLSTTNALSVDNEIGRPTTTITWNARTEKIEIFDRAGDQIVNQKICSVPVDLLDDIKKLWGRAKICRTEYILPPDSVRCLAAALPYAYLSLTDSIIELKNSVCLGDKVELCEELDQETLKDIIAQLWTRKDELVCDSI